MSRAPNRSDGDIVRDFLSVADLLEEPRLARLYAFLTREEESTVEVAMNALDLPQGTAYSYVNRLVDAGVVEATGEAQPRTYAAREIDLTVTTAAGDREYTITPALIAAVGRRTIDDDIDTYIDRYGIDGLATALTYAVDRERGEVTHRSMATDLDISPLAAEIILQALRPVVHEYFDVETAGGSVEEVEEGGNRLPKNLMETLLHAVREQYIEEHGEEPPEEFMQRARNEIVHNVASRDREEHRDIYDALANE